MSLRIAMIHESEYTQHRWPRFTLIAQALQTIGHNVAIYSFGKSRPQESDSKVFDVNGGLLTYLLSVFLHVFSRRVVFGFGLNIPLIRQLNRFHPDIIIFHYTHVGMALLIARQVLGWHSLLVYDWNDLNVRMGILSQHRRGRNHFWAWLEERLVPRNSDYVIVVSNFAKKLVASWGIPADRIAVVNELVPLKLSRAAMERRRNRPLVDRTIVWHGFVRPYQIPGLMTVVRALAQLPSTERPRFRIVGPFSSEADRQRIGKMASRLGVAVEMTGYVHRDVLDTLLDSGDAGIQVLPNELFAHFINGVKLAEYISHGLPVLCSRLEGPSELVNGNGLLYDPSNPEELAAAIASLFSARYPEFLDSAVEVAHREFSEEAILSKIAELMEKLELISPG